MGCNVSSADPGSSMFHARYSFGEKLARGSFGQVHACTSRDTAVACAVKVVKTDSLILRIKANEDAFVWQRVGSHRNVVSLIECFTDNNLFYFVMEICERTFLEKLQMRESRREAIQEHDILDTFWQVLAGLRHCHSKRVAHRDVRPGTFLVKANGDVKLSDFGLSALVPLDGLDGCVGTCSFMSPEMVLQRAYGCKTDVWACGVSAYLCFYGEYPYQALDTGTGSRDTKRSKPSTDSKTQSALVLEAIASDAPKPQYKAAATFSKPSVHVKGFVQELLQRYAVARPTADEAWSLVLTAINRSHKHAQKNAIMQPQARLGDHLLQYDESQKKMLGVTPEIISDDIIKQPWSPNSRQAENVSGSTSAEEYSASDLSFEGRDNVTGLSTTDSVTMCLDIRQQTDLYPFKQGRLLSL